MQYKGIKPYLEKYLNDNIKEKVLKMYDNIVEDFEFWPASVKYHHNFQGGLSQHTEEVIYYGLKIFKSIEEECRQKLITESDVIFLCFIHDFEKMGKYVQNDKYDEDLFQANIYEFKYNYSRIDVNDAVRVMQMCAKYNINLNEKQANALTFIHGGWSVDKGKMLGLAVIIHTADLMSMTFNDKNKKG